MVQSLDERVRSDDIPMDMTDMMAEEHQKQENVTTYVVMSLLNKSSSQDTGAHEDGLMLDSGANIHCSRTTAGMRKVKINKSKVVVADKSKVAAQYKGNLAIVTEEGNATVVLQDVQVMKDFHS